MRFIVFVFALNVCLKKRCLFRLPIFLNRFLIYSMLVNLCFRNSWSEIIFCNNTTRKSLLEKTTTIGAWRGWRNFSFCLILKNEVPTTTTTTASSSSLSPSSTLSTTTTTSASPTTTTTSSATTTTTSTPSSNEPSCNVSETQVFRLLNLPNSNRLFLFVKSLRFENWKTIYWNQPFETHIQSTVA